jgi:hypothetical protein
MACYRSVARGRTHHATVRRSRPVSPHHHRSRLGPSVWREVPAVFAGLPPSRAPRVLAIAAGGESASQTDWPRDALSLRCFRFVEACRSLVRGIAQHRPNHRTLPTRDSLARRNALFVQHTRDGTDAQTRDGVVFIDLTHHSRLSIDDGIRGTRSVPIVFVLVADPVGAGFVDSLAHPGGNATGSSRLNMASAGNGWSCSRSSRQA